LLEVQQVPRWYILGSYCIVLYCIALSLYIYIALLALHINQKRFQFESQSSLERTKRGTWVVFGVDKEGFGGAPKTNAVSRLN